MACIQCNFYLLSFLVVRKSVFTLLLYSHGRGRVSNSRTPTIAGFMCKEREELYRKGVKERTINASALRDFAPSFSRSCCRDSMSPYMSLVVYSPVYHLLSDTACFVSIPEYPCYLKVQWGTICRLDKW